MSDEEREPDHDDPLPAERSTYVTSRAYCSSCNHVTKPFYGKCPQCEGARNRDRVDQLRDVIRELKEGVDGFIAPDRERELVKLLTTYDHPDPKGLLDALEARRNAPKTKQRGRS